jgi:hypothetical protein
MSYDPEKMLIYCFEQDKKRQEEYDRRKEEKRKQYFEQHGQDPPKKRNFQEQMYVDAESPSAIDNDVATIWYIIIMVIGAIFNDRITIWIIATVIWWRHINRKKIRQREWDKKHKGDKK